MDILTFRKLALSKPDAAEVPHFDKPSFRVRNKIFATLWENENRAMLALRPEDQSVFAAYDAEAFFPVPGGWGRQGATFVQLDKVRDDMFGDALQLAYEKAGAGKGKRKRK